MTKKINTEVFDQIFDEGKEDIIDYLEIATAKRPNRRTRKVNVDLPEWMISSLDAEADRLAINRQAVIKTWLAERIDGSVYAAR